MTEHVFQLISAMRGEGRCACGWEGTRFAFGLHAAPPAPAPRTHFVVRVVKEPRPAQERAQRPALTRPEPRERPARQAAHTKAPRVRGPRPSRAKATSLRLWRPDQDAHLQLRYGRDTDVEIGAALGRSPAAVKARAKALDLKKRSIGMNARQVAAIFGVDQTIVSKDWIGTRRLMRPRQSVWYQGTAHMWIIEPAEIERFIRDHGEWIDIWRMPEGPYRDLAVTLGAWLSTTAVMARTGRHAHVLSNEIARGRWEARRRGAHWYIHESQLPAISASGHPSVRASAERYAARVVARRTRRHEGQVAA